MPRTDSVKQIEADAAYWNELAQALGWTLHGFTFRAHASFVTTHAGDSLASISGPQRDDIMFALTPRKASEWLGR